MAQINPQPSTGKNESLGRRLFNVLNERFGLDALAYEVPAHANTLPFTLGGLTMVSTVITVISGVFLAQWYTPEPEVANESMRNIMQNVYLGYIFRGVHYWGAQFTLAFIILHLLRVFFYGSYKRPREGNWLVGVLLFGTMAGTYFTGTALKWDQEGYEGLQHNVELAEFIGYIGGWFSPEFADENISQLMRIYISHVSILPLILLALVFIHILLIKRQKISPLPWTTNESGPVKMIASDHDKPHNFAYHFKSLVGYGYIVLGVTIFLSVLFPPVVGPNPESAIEVTKPVWPFLSMFTLEEFTGLTGAFWASIILFVGLIAVPFIDRGYDQRFSKRKFIIAIGVIALAAVIIATLYAYISGTPVHSVAG